MLGMRNKQRFYPVAPTASTEAVLAANKVAWDRERVILNKNT
jgi:hypothetical protein